MVRLCYYIWYCKVQFLIGSLLALMVYFILLFTILTRVELVNTLVFMEFPIFKHPSHMNFNENVCYFEEWQDLFIDMISLGESMAHGGVKFRSISVNNYDECTRYFLDLK